MHRSYRFIASIFLAGALVAPVSVIAAPSPQVALQVLEYSTGITAITTTGMTAKTALLSRLSCGESPDSTASTGSRAASRQNNYWKWRHEHPDHD